MIRTRPVRIEDRFNALDKRLQQRYHVCPVAHALIQAYLYGDATLESMLTELAVVYGAYRDTLMSDRIRRLQESPAPIITFADGGKP